MDLSSEYFCWLFVNSNILPSVTLVTKINHTQNWSKVASIQIVIKVWTKHKFYDINWKKNLCKKYKKINKYDKHQPKIMVNMNWKTISVENLINVN